MGKIQASRFKEGIDSLYPGHPDLVFARFVMARDWIRKRRMGLYCFS